MVDTHPDIADRRAADARRRSWTARAELDRTAAPARTQAAGQIDRCPYEWIMWSPAFVAIGSNLSNPAQQVARAFERLASIRETLLVSRSRLYRSAPLGPQDQPEFVNACAGLLTQLSAEALLAALRDIERAMGKVP